MNNIFPTLKLLLLLLVVTFFQMDMSKMMPMFSSSEPDKMWDQFVKGMVPVITRVVKFCKRLPGTLQRYPVRYNAARYVTTLPGTLQHCPVCYDIARYVTTLLGMLQHCPVRYNAARYVTTLPGMLQRCPVCCNAARHVTTLPGMLQCCPVRYNENTKYFSNLCSSFRHMFKILFYGCASYKYHTTHAGQI